MTLVSLSWANDGEPVEISPLPLAAIREIREVKRKRAKTIADLSRANFLSRCSIILAVKEILDKAGPKEAMVAWNTDMARVFIGQVAESLVWSEEDFKTKFDTWYDRECLERLGVTNKTDADAKVKTEMESFDLVTLNDAMVTLELDCFAIEAWWKLKRQVKTIDLDGTDVPFNRENLEKVLTLQDMPIIRGQSKEPSFEDQTAVHTEEEVLKN